MLHQLYYYYYYHDYDYDYDYYYYNYNCCCCCCCFRNYYYYYNYYCDYCLLLLLLLAHASWSSRTGRGRTGQAAWGAVGLRHRHRLACHCGILVVIFFHCNGPMLLPSKSSLLHSRKKAPSSPLYTMIDFRWPRAMASHVINASRSCWPNWNARVDRHKRQRLVVTANGTANG